MLLSTDSVRVIVQTHSFSVCVCWGLPFFSPCRGAVFLQRCAFCLPSDPRGSCTSWRSSSGHGCLILWGCVLHTGKSGWRWSYQAESTGLWTGRLGLGRSARVLLWPWLIWLTVEAVQCWRWKKGLCSSHAFSPSCPLFGVLYPHLAITHLLAFQESALCPFQASLPWAPVYSFPWCQTPWPCYICLYIPKPNFFLNSFLSMLTYFNPSGIKHDVHP
jgi:hypothetical protein